MKNEHLIIVASAILSAAAASLPVTSFAAECCPKTPSGKMVYELVPNVVIPDTIVYKPAPKNQAHPADMVMSSNYPASYVPYPSYYLPYPTQFRSIQQAIYPVTSVPEDLEAFAQPVTIPSQTIMPQPQAAPQTAPQTRNETKNEIRLVSASEASEARDSNIATCEGNEEKSDATSIKQTASAWSFSSPIFKVASVPAPVLGSGQNSSFAQTSKFGTTQVNMPPGMYDMPIPYDKCAYGANCGQAAPHHCAVRAYIAQKIQYKQAQQQMLQQMQMQQWQMMQQPQMPQQPMMPPQQLPPQAMMNPYGVNPYAAMNPQMNQMMNAVPNPLMNPFPNPMPMTYQVAPVMSPYGMQPQFVPQPQFPQQFPQPQFVQPMMMPQQQFAQQLPPQSTQVAPMPPQAMPLTGAANLAQEGGFGYAEPKNAVNTENGENVSPAPVMSPTAPSIAANAMNTAAMNTAAPSEAMPQQAQVMMQGMMPYPQQQYLPPYGMAPSSTLTPYDIALLATLLKGNSRRDAVKERRQEKRSPAATTDPLSMLMQAWGTPSYPQGVTARMPSKTAYPWGYFGAQSAPQQTANFGGYYNNTLGSTTQPGM